MEPLSLVLTITVSAAIAAIAVAVVALSGSSADRARMDRIEQQLCAFRFEEDGSASPRDDDGDRLACMYQHGYRAR